MDWRLLEEGAESTGPWPVRWDGRVVGQLDAEGTITISDPEILRLVHQDDDAPPVGEGATS